MASPVKHTLKIEHLNPINIESEVPALQTLREPEDVIEVADANETVIQDDKVGISNETWSTEPVITVTKKEVTLTTSKADYKLQKVTIVEPKQNGGLYIASNPFYTEIISEVIEGPYPVRVTDHEKHDRDDERQEKDAVEDKKSKTKIPIAKFKQTIEKIKEKSNKKEKDKEEAPPSHIPRRSSIPILKDSKLPQARTDRDRKEIQDDPEKDRRQTTKEETKENNESKTEEEFDKIFEEMVDSNEIINDDNILVTPTEDPAKVENSFEEIIHDYEDNKVQPINAEKVEKAKHSKIPLLKRRSEHEIKIPKPSERRSSLKSVTSVDKFRTGIPRAKDLKGNFAETKRHETQNVKPTQKEDIKHDSPDIFITNEVEIIDFSPDIKRIDNEENKKKASVHLDTDENSTYIIKVVPDNENFGKLITNKVPIIEPSLDDITKTDDEEEKREKSVLLDVNKHFTNNNEVATDNNNIDAENNNHKDDISDSELIVKETIQVVTPVFEITTPEHKNTNDVYETLQKKNIEKTSEKEEQMEYLPENVEIKQNEDDEREFRSGYLEPPPTSRIYEDNPFSYNNKNIDDPKETSDNDNITNKDSNTNIKLESVKQILEDHNNDNILEEETPVIKGKVSRMIKRLVSKESEVTKERNGKFSKRDIDEERTRKERINKISEPGVDVANTNMKKEVSDDVPKKKSILSKIAMFERQQSNENFPTSRKPVPEKKVIETPKETIFRPDKRSIDSTSREPRIVEHVLKTTKKEIEIHDDDNKPQFPTKDLLSATKDPVVIENTQINEDHVKVSENLNEETVVYEKVNVYVAKEINPYEQDNNNQDSITNNELASNNAITVPQEVAEKCTDDLETNGALEDEIDVIDESTIDENEFKEPENNNRNEITQPTEQINDSNNYESKEDKIQITEETNKNERCIEDKEKKSNKEEKVEKLPPKEETNIRRTKSVAELDLGNSVKGIVKNMIVRINSVEVLETDKKEVISIKERPKKRSVLEKIALFEKKFTLTKTQESTVTPAVETTTATSSCETTTETQPPETFSEEEYEQRISELNNAKKKYGRFINMTYIKLDEFVYMPTLIVGTALLDTRLVKPIISAAIDLGYRAFDTAYIYGNEKEVGEAIRAKIEDGTVTRQQLFIINKLWSTFHDPDLVETAYNNSLNVMGLEAFDLYLIHNPMSFKEGPDPVPKIAKVLQFSKYDYLDAWFGMERLYSKGLVKSIGVSNFNSVQLGRIVEKGKVKPVINQVECHPYLTQLNLDSYCTAKKVKVNCYGTLGSKGTPAEFKAHQTPVIDDPVVVNMAATLKVSPAQLLLRYQIERGHAVTVKASTGAHLWDNLLSLEFLLSPEQVEILNGLNRNKRTFTFKGMGDTHKNYPFKIPF